MTETETERYFIGIHTTKTTYRQTRTDRARRKQTVKEITKERFMNGERKCQIKTRERGRERGQMKIEEKWMGEEGGGKEEDRNEKGIGGSGWQ